MKKLLLLLTLVGMFATACEEAGVDGGVNGPAVSYDHNKIWYTNGSTSKPTLPSDLSAFGGASLVSNEYDTKKECWVITFDRNVTTIGGYAFYGCSSLISITIPDSVVSIRRSAFNGCSSLTSITIPNSVMSIEGFAFSDCSSLTSITIPDGVTSIEEYAFEGCSSMKEVYCKSTTPPAGGSWMFSSISLECKIYVPTESVEAYKAAEYWKNYADYIVGYDFLAI